MRALLEAAGVAAAAHRDDPAFRARLDAALTEYAGTRAAAAEIATGLIALGSGAIAFKQVTPGALALGPAIAASFAQSAAVASFPLGATAGGLWYGAFPAQASPLLVAGATAGVVGVAALATAFAGMIADPVQRALGLHARRLRALIDAIEAAFAGERRGRLRRLRPLRRPADGSRRRADRHRAGVPLGVSAPPACERDRGARDAAGLRIGAPWVDRGARPRSPPRL